MVYSHGEADVIPKMVISGVTAVYGLYNFYSAAQLRENLIAEDQKHLN